MPSLVRTIGLILVAASPACLVAQPPSEQSDRRPAWADLPGKPMPVAPSMPLDEHRGGVVPAAFCAETAAFRAETKDDPLQAAGRAPQAGSAPMPISPPRGAAALPLPAPGRSQRGDAPNAVRSLPSLITVASSLAVVLGLFSVVVWALRRSGPPGGLLLPGEVLEVLGRASLAHRQQVYLLRCGRKLLLVSVTPAGAETLSEIIDPPEVDRLAGLCRQAHPQSATAAFRQILDQWQGTSSAEQSVDVEPEDRGPSRRPAHRDPWEKTHA